MSRFNTKVDNTTTNKAGGKAFKMNAEQELLHAVLTTFLDDKYYESGDNRLTRIQGLVAKCDPVFVANLAYVSRIEFNLRSVSTVLLGELAKIHKGDDLVMRAIKNTVTRVDDLTELASYLECKLPKQVKRGIRRALYKFSPYKLAKYRGEKKEVKLVDIFNMVHPKPQFATEEQQKAWKDLIEGNLKSTGKTWEAVISSSNAENKKDNWEKLILENKMGYMALLRNLNNLIKNDVSQEVLNKAIAKLTDREEVKRSKQLPFRFVTAYDNVSGNRQLTDAISVAMDYAVDNTPELNGSTLIAIDCSGSMSGRPMEIASIFGSTLAKANVNADLILYDTSVYEFAFSSRMPVIDLAKKIQSEARGGGTNTSLVFAYAEDKRKEYDRIIIISDNESWADSYGWYGREGGTQAQYNQYKNIMKIDPYVYAIDIEGYGTKDISSQRVIHLTGWSDRLLDFIGIYEKGGSMVEYIKSIVLE